MTCLDCYYFFNCSEYEKPILDDCACLLPLKGKNYFVNLEPCEDFKPKEEKK